MKKTAVYPGTFDPVTYGHLDLIHRAAAIFDKVIVAILVNQNKAPVFTTQMRRKHLEECIKDLPNVKVESFDGLLVDFMRAKNATVAIRGLRAVTDLEYEFQLANTNRELYKEMETVFLMPNAKYTYLTSSMMREVYKLGGELDKFLPPHVSADLKKAMKK